MKFSYLKSKIREILKAHDDGLINIEEAENRILGLFNALDLETDVKLIDFE
jgi:hypothetical protein